MSSEDDQMDEPFSKKRKTHRACDNCRKKKRRCYEPKPPHTKCLGCIEHDLECTYEHEPKKRGRPKGYVEGLEKRVQMLEDLLRKACPDESAVRGLLSSTYPKNPYSSSTVDTPTTSKDPTGTSAMQSMMHKITALTLESQDDPFRDEEDSDHIALTERVKALSIEPEDGNRFWGKSSNAMFMHTAILFKNEYEKGLPNLNKRAMFQNRRPEYWVTFPWEKDHLKFPTLSYIFPPSDLTTQLVNAYFEHVNLFYPLLHRPAFERAIADNLHLRDKSFGAVLLLVCAVGSRYSEAMDEGALGNGMNMLLMSGWKWYSQVQVVKPAHILEPATLYDLQSYCLAVEFLLGCTSPHPVWILVGFGIRLAQDVGAHRRRVPRNKLTAEDELWKRAFWVLVAIDRTFSMAIGRQCAIFDDHFDLDMPVECDDEYWEHPDPTQRFKQPENVPCTVTAFNQQLRLSKIISFALHTVYSIKTKFWEFMLKQWETHIVADLDSALNKWKSSLPSYLQWDPNHTDDRFYRLSGSLITTYYYIQILIHRPFIRAKSQLPSPLSYPSLEICTIAARSCLLIVEQQMLRTAVIYPYMQMSAFTSATILLLNIWGSKRTGSTGDPKSMLLIEKCKDMLTKAEERWRMAGRFIDILNELSSVGELVLPEGFSPADEKMSSFSSTPEYSQDSSGPSTEDDTSLSWSKYFLSMQRPVFNSLSPVQSQSKPLNVLGVPGPVPQLDYTKRTRQEHISSHLYSSSTTVSTPSSGHSSDLSSSILEEDTTFHRLHQLQHISTAYSTQFPPYASVVPHVSANSNSNADTTSSQQSEQMSSDTMSMWLDAPTGIELDEWNIFIANLYANDGT